MGLELCIYFTLVNTVRTRHRCLEFPLREQWLCREHRSLYGVCRSHTSLWSIFPVGTARRQSPHPSLRNRTSGKHVHTHSRKDACYFQPYDQLWWIRFISKSQWVQWDDLISKHTWKHTSVSICVLSESGIALLNRQKNNVIGHSGLVCVCIFLWLVVFRMTNSSLSFLASISSHLHMADPLSGEAEQATHTLAYAHTKNILSCLFSFMPPFHLSFPSYFHLSIKTGLCLLALGYSRTTLEEI